MNRISVLLVIFSLVISTGNAQELKIKKGDEFPRPVCYASNKVEKSFIPPPTNFVLKSASTKSDIIVEYTNFPEDAKAAFEYAVGIWETIVESDRPIRVKAEWDSTLDENTLGACGPETYYANFENAPIEDCYYPVAIAEKISGEELNGASRADMEAVFSSKIDWYLGTDGETPDTTYDFVSIVMHEICHGLGFTGFFFVDDNIGAYGYNEMGDFTSFDYLVETYSGNQLLDTAYYRNSSNDLKEAILSSALYANSPIAMSSNSGTRPRLYAPTTYSEGSSIYHLNEVSYPAGNENSLMTYAAGMGEAIHDPGPLTRGILEDMGWTNLFIHFSPPKDKETVEPIDFPVVVESEYEIDSSSMMVIYSYDTSFESLDTLQLVATDEPATFSAQLEPEASTESISYYVTVWDKKGRIRTSPSIAPQKVYTTTFGADNEYPEISHEPISYFLLMDTPLSIELNADDNLGVDTVYVNYSINNQEQTPFGVSLADGTMYSGEFPFNLEELQDGDSIRYQIVAADSSIAVNTSVFPEDTSFVFQVEQIFEPVTTYWNEFNEETSDFIINDFDIYTASGFEDGALNSVHPYLSPENDNEEYNYTTFLKRPIIVQEDGTMSFDEVVLVEPGETLADYGDDDFWDYVIVEASKDYTETWFELADGYDSGNNSVWKQNYISSLNGQVSKAVGDPEWFVNHQISLTESENISAGDTIIIRFRLYSDPYANGWGWIIDNLKIQQTVSAPVVELLSGNVNVYPNPFNDELTLDISTGNETAEISVEIFDLFGKKVYTGFYENVLGTMNERVNLTDLKSGMFMIRVCKDGKQVLTKKLIKN